MYDDDDDDDDDENSILLKIGTNLMYIFKETFIFLLAEENSYTSYNTSDNITLFILLMLSGRSKHTHLDRKFTNAILSRALISFQTRYIILG